MSNKMTIKDKFNTYLKHPGSFVVFLLVMLAAVITFAVLIFLIVYILVNGLPHITPSLFSLEYSSENASVGAGPHQHSDHDAALPDHCHPLWYLFRYFPCGICRQGQQVRGGHTSYNRNTFRYSLHRVRPVWYALLRKHAGVGLLTSGPVRLPCPS